MINEKTFTLNYDNPSELKKVIGILQKRRKNLLRELGFNSVDFNSSKYNANNLIPIFDSFIDSLQINKGNYYVYLHSNPLQGLAIKDNIKDMWLATRFGLRYKPFYVGKGISNRAYDLNRNDSHRKIRHSIKQNGKDIQVDLIFQNLDEESALKLESVLIEVLGLKSLSKHGYLVNLDEGKERVTVRETYSANKLKVIRSNGFFISDNMKYILNRR